MYGVAYRNLGRATAIIEVGMPRPLVSESYKYAASAVAL